MVPQLHLRRSERCSMQLSSGFGTSKTCLDSIDSIGASMRSALQLEQAVGIWLITSSGSTLWELSFHRRSGTFSGRPFLHTNGKETGAWGYRGTDDVV